MAVNLYNDSNYFQRQDKGHSVFSPQGNKYKLRPASDFNGNSKQYLQQLMKIGVKLKPLHVQAKGLADAQAPGFVGKNFKPTNNPSLIKGDLLNLTPRQLQAVVLLLADATSSQLHEAEKPYIPYSKDYNNPIATLELDQNPPSIRYLKDLRDTVYVNNKEPFYEVLSLVKVLSNSDIEELKGAVIPGEVNDGNIITTLGQFPPVTLETLFRTAEQIKLAAQENTHMRFLKHSTLLESQENKVHNFEKATSGQNSFLEKVDENTLILDKKMLSKHEPYLFLDFLNKEYSNSSINRVYINDLQKSNDNNDFDPDLSFVKIPKSVLNSSSSKNNMDDGLSQKQGQAVDYTWALTLGRKFAVPSYDYLKVAYLSTKEAMIKKEVQLNAQFRQSGEDKSKPYLFQEHKNQDIGMPSFRKNLLDTKKIQNKISIDLYFKSPALILEEGKSTPSIYSFMYPEVSYSFMNKLTVDPNSINEVYKGLGRTELSIENYDLDGRMQELYPEGIDKANTLMAPVIKNRLDSLKFKDLDVQVNHKDKGPVSQKRRLYSNFDHTEKEAYFRDKVTALMLFFLHTNHLPAYTRFSGDEAGEVFSNKVDEHGDLVYK